MGGELIQSMDGEGVAYTVTKDDFECPLGWAWSGAWLVDNTKGDPEGLCNAWIVINPFGVHNHPFGVHCYLGDMKHNCTLFYWCTLLPRIYMFNPLVSLLLWRLMHSCLSCMFNFLHLLIS